MADLRLVWHQTLATARLTRDLPRFARDVVSRDDARERVRARVDGRERTFLDTARWAVFDNRRSPLRRLLEHAGCTYPELVRLVEQNGLEGALQALARNGVYVTQAEVKGRAAIVRGSLRFHAPASSFDNPRLRPHFVVPTSGSSGRQLFVGRSLRELGEIGDVLDVSMATFGMHRPAYAKWSTLPHALIEKIHLGLPIVGWFNPLGGIPLSVRLLQVYTCAIARAGGATIAWPRDRSLTQPDVLAAWLAETARQHPRLLIDATASSATRVSAAATARGISLEGITWMPRGEPLTAARQRIINASGAQSLPLYSTVETGPLAIACGARSGPDEMHLRSERFAIVPTAQSAGPGPSDSAPSRALLVTSLGPLAPKVLLNAESGDSATFLDGPCGCALDEVGLTRRIANVRSFEKLTGEGVTLVDTDIVAVIEDVLPATLGGRPGDYQLVETEDRRGATRLVLRVHPDLAQVDEEAARATLLSAIAAQSSGNRHMARLLEVTASVRIERQRPWVTSSGKSPAFVPLRALRAHGTPATPSPAGRDPDPRR